MSDDDLLESNDNSSQGADDLPGQPTEENLKKRIELRRAHEKYEAHRRWARRKRQQKTKYDPIRIAKNLRALMKSQGLSIQDTIAAISKDGKYESKECRWLKRVATKGVVQTDARTMTRLGKLADYFGVTLEQLRTDDLDRMAIYQEFCRPDSPGFRRYACMLEELLSDDRFESLEVTLLLLHFGMESHGSVEGAVAAEADRLAKAMMDESRGDNKRQQRCIRMLSRLLQTGTHEYLKDLITELYGILTRQWAACYEDSSTELVKDAKQRIASHTTQSVHYTPR